MKKELYLLILKNTDELKFTLYTYDLKKETEKTLKYSRMDEYDSSTLSIKKEKMDKVLRTEGMEGVKDTHYRAFTMDETEIPAFKKEMLRLLEEEIENEKQMLLEAELDIERLQKEIEETL